MENDTLKKVIDFFEKYTRLPINEDTEINNDLELMGDDADCMLLDFMKKFEVNFENIDFTKYFVPELVFKYWYYKWFKPEKLRRTPLTIGHMIDVVRRGHWFDPR